MIRVRFLGTAAARPTVARNVAGIAVHRTGRAAGLNVEAETVLWDCGEGTQRQLMRFGAGFSFSHVFVTHAHADHFLGLPGLLRTMGLQGRQEDLTVYGPPSARAVLQTAVQLGVGKPTFRVEVRGVEPGERIAFDGWSMHVFRVDHGVPAVGYALVEEARLGRFDIERARALGIPEGPLFGRLHRGETVEIEGRSVSPADVVGPSRPGRKVVYAGDTRPCRETVSMARGADLLVHEATFAAEEGVRARETRHSTAAEAAEVAARAGAGRLVLTHVSARYSDRPRVLEAEARDVFPASVVAHDGLLVEIGFRD